MYPKHNNGLFTVEVDSLSDPPLNSLSVGRILHKSFKDEILNCKKKGPSRTTILCKSAFSANKIVENLEKINSKLKAFIPNFRVIRLGIVRNIPLDILMEDLKEHAISSVPIINAKRFERKDQHGKFIPTSTVLLTFDDQTLPQEIKIFFNRCSVVPYFSQPKVCFGCFRHDHVKSICKNPRCLHRGEKPHEGQSCPKINETPFCLNCQGSQWVSNKKCPKFLDEQEIRKIFAFQNINIKSSAYLYKKEKLNPGKYPILTPKFLFLSLIPPKMIPPPTLQFFKLPLSRYYLLALISTR